MPGRLITGARGQLGSALVRCVRERGEVHWGFGTELDLCDARAVERAIDTCRPDVLLNAAAFTRVDECEAEPERAYAVNAEAPGQLARICADRGVGLVHISTDYVFDGTADKPYTEGSVTSPRSVYGASKRAGEEAVRASHPTALIVRTSWLFGNGPNFVATILGQAARSAQSPGHRLRVVHDQRGRPTWALDVARAIGQLVDQGAEGLFHVANDGEATWWELARQALDWAGFSQVPIEPIPSEEMPRPAPRPAYSVLDTTKARGRGVKLPDWRAALRSYLHSAESPVRMSETG